MNKLKLTLNRFNRFKQALTPFLQGLAFRSGHNFSTQKDLLFSVVKPTYDVTHAGQLGNGKVPGFGGDLGNSYLQRRTEPFI
ncbi:hypothetical protein HRG84_21765 [Flavisolibacter sp. BT320]|nr:hypothetical protein [Flavisolibacter longurius]